MNAQKKLQPRDLTNISLYLWLWARSVSGRAWCSVCLPVCLRRCRWPALVKDDRSDLETSGPPRARATARNDRPRRPAAGADTTSSEYCRVAALDSEQEGLPPLPRARLGLTGGAAPAVLPGQTNARQREY